MSYHIYNTKGIILKRKISGESDTTLYILTEDLGLIIAGARATRTQSSKLKGSLQEYSLSYLSLVKGRNGWKLTNASLIRNFYYDSAEFSRKILAQVSSMLTKTIVGEIPHKEIFMIVEKGFERLIIVNKESLVALESLIVLRVLKELGYVVSNQETEMYFKNMDDWADGLIDKAAENNIKIVSLINKAIRESQL